MTYLVTWKGSYQNIEIARHASKAAAKAVLDSIEDPSIGGAEVDNELDLAYTKNELVTIFNKLAGPDDPQVQGFPSKAEGQRRVFSRIEDLGKALPITEAPASEPQPTEAVASDQPQETDDMAAKAKKTTKPRKTAKAPKVAKAKTNGNGAHKDAFGLRAGSKASQAAAMMARKNGATMANLNEATGANQYNLIKSLTEAGHKVEKEGKTFFATAKA